MLILLKIVRVFSTTSDTESHIFHRCFVVIFPVLQYCYSLHRLHTPHIYSTYLLLWDKQFKLSSHLQWISIWRWQRGNIPPNTATNTYFHSTILQLWSTHQAFVLYSFTVGSCMACVCVPKSFHIFILCLPRRLDLNYDVIIKIILLFI